MRCCSSTASWTPAQSGNRRSAGSTPTFRRSRSIFRAWASFVPMPGKSRSNATQPNRALIEQIGKPIILVAQMGAQIAELAAIAARARVKGLVLLAPVPLAGVNAPPEVVASFKRVGGDAVLQRETRRNLSFKLSQEAEALLGEFGDVVKPATVAALVDAWNNGDSAGTVARPFTGPVLVVRGADDPFCYRRHGQRGRSAIYPCADPEGRARRPLASRGAATHPRRRTARGLPEDALAGALLEATVHKHSQRRSPYR
jgi:pimeloyl-ACP methyl ester carboxylesterase